MGKNIVSQLKDLKVLALRVFGGKFIFLFNKIYALRGKDGILIPTVALLGIAIMFLDVETGATISLRPLFFAPVILLSFVHRRSIAVLGSIAIACLAVLSFKTSNGFQDDFQYLGNLIPTALVYLLLSEFVRYMLFAVQKLHTNIVFLQDMLRDYGSRRA